MLKVEIVSHVWRYSRVLAYQLSSLVLCPPRRVRVTLRVLYADEDKATGDVLKRFANQTPVVPTIMPRNLLLRRSIGRDMIARKTEADVVWFTDADICFYEKALDSFATVFWQRAPLWYPDKIRQTKTRQIGDKYAAKADSAGILFVSPNDCHTDTIVRASGAYQIVPGDVCRRHGYVTDRAVDRQLVEGTDFISSRSDVRFRNQIAKLYGTPPAGKPVRIPNLVRIRQSQFGRVDLPPVSATRPPHLAEIAGCDTN